MQRKALVEMFQRNQTSFNDSKQHASIMQKPRIKELQAQPSLSAPAVTAPATFLPPPPPPRRRSAAHAPRLTKQRSAPALDLATARDEEQDEHTKRMHFSKNSNARNFSFSASPNDNKENKRFFYRNRSEANKVCMPSLFVTSYPSFQEEHGIKAGEKNLRDDQEILAKRKRIRMPRIETTTKDPSKNILEKEIRKCSSTDISLPKVHLPNTSIAQKWPIHKPDLLVTLPKIPLPKKPVAKQGRIRPPGTVHKGLAGEGSSRVTRHRDKPLSKSSFAAERTTGLPGILHVEDVGGKISHWNIGVLKEKLPKTSSTKEGHIRSPSPLTIDDTTAERTCEDTSLLKSQFPTSPEGCFLCQMDVFPEDSIGEDNAYGKFGVPKLKLPKTSDGNDEPICQEDSVRNKDAGDKNEDGKLQAPAIPPLLREKPLDLKQVLAWKARRRAKAEALNPLPYTKSISKYVVPPLRLKVW